MFQTILLPTPDGPWLSECHQAQNQNQMYQEPRRSKLVINANMN